MTPAPNILVAAGITGNLTPPLLVPREKRPWIDGTCGRAVLAMLKRCLTAGAETVLGGSRRADNGSDREVAIAQVPRPLLEKSRRDLQIYSQIIRLWLHLIETVLTS